MNLLDARNRGTLIDHLTIEKYDLIVIGGGITGAGIALDAVSRGLQVALVEKSDFASGTSSKSTKLIHGGLRYLKQFEIALVREVGHERAIVHNLAPHLVKSERMLLPLIKDGTYGKIMTSVGLMVYDVLAGVEKIDQRKMLTKEETMAKEPLLHDEKIEGGGIYAEYRTDDARLTIEVIKTAVKKGAHIINYVEATDFIYDEHGKVRGIECVDHLTNKTFSCNSSYTISAAGPWVDELRAKNKSLTGKKLHPTKGVHIVLPHEKFPVKQSVYFDVPDGRMIFAIPRDRVTYIGTTDTDYFGDLDDVRTEKKDVEYLIDGVKHIFPDIKLEIEDVESSWAGLRPLIEEEGKSASQLSRKDEIFESESGLMSIAGGKLTGYRKMAERIIDKLSVKLSEEDHRIIGPCITENLILTGGVFKNAKEVKSYELCILEKIEKSGLDPYYAEYLVGNYGKQSDEILDYFDSINHADSEIGLALAELKWTIENESILSTLDFFERRTGRLFFNIKTIPKLIDPIMNYMAEVFDWNDERKASELNWLKKELKVSSEFI